MYDLNVPTQSYEREIEKLRKQISLLDENKDLVRFVHSAPRFVMVSHCDYFARVTANGERRRKDVSSTRQSWQTSSVASRNM